MKKTIIFDIDGTLADIIHRRCFVEDKKNKNWKEFHSRLEQDTPNIPIVEMYQVFHQTNKYHMLIVSGRMDNHRDRTETWLEKHNINFDALLMRKFGDYRPDNEVKQDILNELLANNHDILFVIDDRSRVVDMWRQNGIMCLQCASGDF